MAVSCNFSTEYGEEINTESVLCQLATVFIEGFSVQVSVLSIDAPDPQAPDNLRFLTYMLSDKRP